MSLSKCMKVHWHQSLERFTRQIPPSEHVGTYAKAWIGFALFSLQLFSFILLWRQLFVFLSFFFWPLYTKGVTRRPGYSFCIFKHFLLDHYICSIYQCVDSPTKQQLITKNSLYYQYRSILNIWFCVNDNTCWTWKKERNKHKKVDI